MVKILNILFQELKCDFKDCYSLIWNKVVSELNRKTLKITYSRKKGSDACKGKRRNEPRRWGLHGWCSAYWANWPHHWRDCNFMSFPKIIWRKEFLTGKFDILTRGWRTLPVVERSYPWLVTINYIKTSLPVGKCMYICSKFQSKTYVVRSCQLIQIMLFPDKSFWVFKINA